MKITQELYINIGEKQKVVHFGVPQNKEELDEMFRFRFDVYSTKKYLTLDKFKEPLDIDDYDRAQKCDYFVAKNGIKTIGSIRVIRDEILPTERFFSFEEPEILREIPRNQRAELSRLTVTPFDKEYYLPRNLVLLLFIRNLIIYAKEHNIKGGYSFIKERLKQKLLRLGVPIHSISNFTQTYPDDGAMYPYFHQSDDPVSPMIFICVEISDYIDKTIHNSWMFEIQDENKFVLKNNLYNNFLKKIGAI